MGVCEVGVLTFGYSLEGKDREEEWALLLWEVEGMCGKKVVGTSEECGRKGFATFTAPCVALLRSEQLSDQPLSSLISLLLCSLSP